MNGLIWESMRWYARVDEGFDLTNTIKTGATGEDTKISIAEDVAANMIVNEFRDLDTFYKAKSTTTPANTPAASPDRELDMWELNYKYKMWEVDNMLKTYANKTPNNSARDGKSMNMLEFAKSM